MEKSFLDELENNTDVVIDKGLRYKQCGKLMDAFVIIFAALSFLPKCFAQRLLYEELFEINAKLSMAEPVQYEVDLSPYLKKHKILEYTHYLLQESDKYYGYENEKSICTS